MNIKFYYNSSDDNKLNKSLTQKLNLNGNLREGTSIITPTITIQVSDSQYLSIIESNYVYIQNFKRYYFITDIVCAAKNLWDISMRVDVLMSFKDDILDLPVILDRNEYTYNNYLNDDLLPITNKYEITYSSTHTTDCFSATTIKPLNNDNNIYNGSTNKATLFYNGGGVYIITVLANGTSSLNAMDNSNVTNNSFEGSYILNARSFKEFCIKFNNISWQDIGTNWFSERNNEYLLSIRYYPINITKVAWWCKTPVTSIPIGKLSQISLDDGSVYVPYYSDNIILIGSYTIKFNYMYNRNSNNFFLNLKPYSIYEVYIPYYGYYELDISKCIAESSDNTYEFVIMYYLDYRIGKLLIYINYHKPHNAIYDEFIGDVDFGFEIPVGSTNFTATIANIMHQMTMNGISRALSLGGLAIGAVAAAATGGVSALAVGATASGATNTINNTRTNLHASIQGGGHPSLPGRFNLLYHNVIYVKITSKVSDRPNNYNHNYGLPTNASGTLNTFKGFTKIASTHIENIKFATDNERQIIMDKLTSGILLDPPST